MRFSIGSDEDAAVFRFVAARLREKGHEVSVVPVASWAEVAMNVAREVVERRADQGVVCCWTGTGVSIAANKTRGVRAALCVDAATAAGARKWNDANVLALSLRLTSETIAGEILEAWLGATYDGTEDASLKTLGEKDV